MRDLNRHLVTKKNETVSGRQAGDDTRLSDGIKSQSWPLRSQRTYRRVFHAAPNPYLLLSPDLVITDANSAYLAATMTRYDEIVGKELCEIFRNDQAHTSGSSLRALKASLQTVLSTRVRHKMATLQFDLRCRDGTFEQRYWEAENLPVLDTTGRLTNIIHHVEDKTAWVRLEMEATQCSIDVPESTEAHLTTHGRTGRRYFIVDCHMPGADKPEMTANPNEKGVALLAALIAEEADRDASIATTKAMRVDHGESRRPTTTCRYKSSGRSTSHQVWTQIHRGGRRHQSALHV